MRVGLPVMPRTTATDRKASADEVRTHTSALRELGSQIGVGPVRVRDDGTVVVHADKPGYRQALEFSARATDLVGSYVHVITDDVPGAARAEEL